MEKAPRNVPSVGKALHSGLHDCYRKVTQEVPVLHDSASPCFQVAKSGRSSLFLRYFVAQYQEGPRSYALDPSGGSSSVTTPMSSDPAYDL